MAKKAAKPKPAAVPTDSITHPAARRPNIPTHQTLRYATTEPTQPVEYPRDPSLDPQLVWAGKDQQDSHPLTVPAVPVYVQEKVHPRAIIDDVLRQAKAGQPAADLFADFNGLADLSQKLDFYQHTQHWTNRLILGDSLLVMASLAEKERLRGQVQCVYLDPPYGIKFGSNWQMSTRKRDVKDAKADDLSRQPEQIKAFRDTWELGIHSYLTYLRDRLAAARDLLTESGSCFVQIGDENVHLVRCLMDEVFGSENFVVQITIQKTGGQPSELLAGVADYVIWFAKDRTRVKARMLYKDKEQGVGHGSGGRYTMQDDAGRYFRYTSLTSSRPPGSFPVVFAGKTYVPQGTFWKTGEEGFKRLIAAGRITSTGRMINFKRYLDDFPAYPITSIWTDVGGSADKVYVVQTTPPIVERCLLMTTDPGDLVLDPTCGSGTTAYVAEQWGRRWITIDTSRVALALARTRLMAARFPYYLPADSPAGRKKAAQLGTVLTREPAEAHLAANRS